MIKMKKAIKILMMLALTMNPHAVGSAKAFAKKFSKDSHKSHFRVLSKKESGGLHLLDNPYGHLGESQSEAEAGVLTAGTQDEWASEVKNLHVDGTMNFLGDEQMQAIAERAYTERNWEMISHFGLDRYVGEEIGGVKLTPSGMMAGAHVLGVVSLKNFILYGMDATDANGLHISAYIAQLGGQPISFDADNLREAKRA